MKKLLPVLLLALLCSCQKKKEPDPAPPSATTGGTSTTTGGTQPDPDCKEIPPAPDGFPYIDSTKDHYQNTNAFFYNPLSADEVIVVVEGTILGANEMLNVNLRTRKTIHLAYLDKYLPSINQQGWIVFSTVEDNVFKIKANGDSLTQLTTTSGAHDPKWDRKGATVFFLQDQQSAVLPKLMRVDKKGAVVNSIDQGIAYSAPFRKSNKVLVQRAIGPALTVYQMDLDSASERPVIGGTFNVSTGETSFQNLFVDDNDTYMYWSNSSGIFRCHLGTLVTDTLFRNCQSVICNRPCRSGRLNEITFSKHVITPASPYFLIHQFRAQEYNVVLGQLREVSIF